MRPLHRLRPATALVATALVLSALPVLHATATPAGTGWTALGHGRTVVVKGKPSDGRTTLVTPVDRSGRQLSSAPSIVPAATAARTAPSANALSTTPISTWQINYDAGFNANPTAKAAFQRAVDTWQRAVASPVRIVVDASLTSFQDPSQLGGAGPRNFFNPGIGVWFPVALANSLEGADLDPVTSDISATFADSSSIFYYGADPAGIASAPCTVPPQTTPTNGTCYDFESVVLHELGHGLGFLGSADVDTRGTATVVDDLVYYGIDYPSNTEPFVWDTFTATGDGTAVLDYPNHSVDLTDALTGSSVYWIGAHGASADRGREPSIYADYPFQSGSSFSHVSDASYPQGDPDGLMTPFAEPGDTTRDPGEVMLGMFRDMGWVTPGLPGSTFTPLTPVRVLDTGATKIGNGQSRDLLLGGFFGVPANATAVVLNVTAALPASASVVRVYPVPRAEGAPVPGVSNLNTARNDNRANLVTVPLSAGGFDGTRSRRVRLLNSGGATRLVADLAGYYAPDATTYFHALSTPVRKMDTRVGTGVAKAKIGQGGTVDLTVIGGAVPSSATAVALTVTAVTPSTDTYVSVYPTGSPQTTSNVNLKRGAVAANAVVVRVPASGQLRFRNNAGTVDLVADVAGYYDTLAAGGTLFRPTLPTRLLDTRPGTLGSGVTTDIVVARGNGVPASATAAIVNLTGVGPNAPTFLTAYPTGAALPNASNLNLATGQTAASLAFARLGTGGRVRVRNASGTVALVVDLSGWFGPA